MCNPCNLVQTMQLPIACHWAPPGKDVAEMGIQSAAGGSRELKLTSLRGGAPKRVRDSAEYRLRPDFGEGCPNFDQSEATSTDLGLMLHNIDLHPNVRGCGIKDGRAWAQSCTAL